jgi:hypothetical protein
MTVFTEILLFVYTSGFIGGILCGLPAGIVMTVVWGLARRRRRVAAWHRQREQRAAEAKEFAREVDQWIEEFEAEKANDPKVRVIGK